MCVKVGDKAKSNQNRLKQKENTEQRNKKQNGSNINLTKPRIPNLTFDGRWNNAGLHLEYLNLIYIYELYILFYMRNIHEQVVANCFSTYDLKKRKR